MEVFNTFQFTVEERETDAIRGDQEIQQLLWAKRKWNLQEINVPGSDINGEWTN